MHGSGSKEHNLLYIRVAIIMEIVTVIVTVTLLLLLSAVTVTVTLSLSLSLCRHCHCHSVTVTLSLLVTVLGEYGKTSVATKPARQQMMQIQAIVGTYKICKTRRTKETFQ